MKEAHVNRMGDPI